MGEKILCGVDLGGTKLSVGLFTARGELLAKKITNDHTMLGNHEMTRCIADIIIPTCKEAGISPRELESIGVGLAGHIDSRTGIIITTSNFRIPFRHYPLQQELESLTDTPAVIDNDANAQVLGEYLFGAGRGRQDIVFMTVSTGVGAGIISQGKIFQGHFGFAGEIGHTIVEPASEVQCSCGNKGCLMALCGTLGLSERYEFCLREGIISKLGFEAGKVPKIDGIILEEGLNTGDSISQLLFRESAEYIGIGIYNIYQVINPQTLILGGGLMNLGFGFFNLIKEKFNSLVQNMLSGELEIVLAELGSEAGLLGAAFLPREKNSQCL